MLASTRISLTYKVSACAIVILTCALAYAIWSYQPAQDTLEEVLRPIGLVIVLAAGIIQAYVTATNRLAKRVVRALRFKSL
ncbi:hypothetical protein RCH14_004744 [Massilia sp. MP_M2]|uniref:hypothetical protein n=1 Tax=Massilia sp. MP_M2 TaxID=3071713 RepID=UPI00319D9CC7